MMLQKTKASTPSRELTPQQIFALQAMHRRAVFPYWRYLRRGQAKQRPHRNMRLHQMGSFVVETRDGKQIHVKDCTYVGTDRYLRRQIARAERRRQREAQADA